MVGDPEIGDQGNREMNVDEPGEGIFPLPFAQVSERDIEDQCGNTNYAHEK